MGMAFVIVNLQHVNATKGFLESLALKKNAQLCAVREACATQRQAVANVILDMGDTIARNEYAIKNAWDEETAWLESADARRDSVGWHVRRRCAKILVQTMASVTFKREGASA